MANANKVGVWNMTLPAEGPQVIPLNYDMALATEVEIDLTQAINDGIVSFITGAWIDNSLNGQILSLTCDGSGQVVKFPANKQGYIQLLLPNPPVVNLSQPAFGGLVKLCFTNFPVFPYIF